MEDLDQTVNITGLSTLVNRAHVNPGIDLAAIEQEIIGTPNQTPEPKENDPMIEFKRTIQELSRDTGIDFGNTEITEPPALPTRPASRASSVSSAISRKSAVSDHDRRADRASRKYNHQFENVDDDEEELRDALLEDIDELENELRQFGLDVTRWNKPKDDASIEDLRRYRNTLQLKYDRVRCNTIGNDAILTLVRGLEWLFNGERKFGPLKPDLTDWHNTVRPKLRRMKYETSSIVSQILRGNNIGPAGRICVELIPSAIIYSKMRSDQRGKTNYTPDQMSEAYEDLRKFA